MKSQYQAYLLRLHRSQNQMHWRVTMENAHTSELLRFATERELLRYLMKLLLDEPDSLSKSTEMNRSSFNS